MPASASSLTMDRSRCCRFAGSSAASATELSSTTTLARRISAAYGAWRQRAGHDALHAMHHGQYLGLYADASLDAAGQARRCRQLARPTQAESCPLADHPLPVDARFDKGMTHRVLPGRCQTGTIVSEIVEIGARNDLPVRASRQGTVEIFLQKKQRSTGLDGSRDRRIRRHRIFPMSSPAPVRACGSAPLLQLARLAKLH